MRLRGQAFGIAPYLQVRLREQVSGIAPCLQAWLLCLRVSARGLRL
ncbi:hypothetical protein [Streptomyces sp. NPDC056628]